MVLSSIGKNFLLASTRTHVQEPDHTEIESLKTNGFTEKELKDKKNTFLTQYYMSLETNASQAAIIGDAEILSTWRLNEKLISEVNKLTTAELQNVVKKHIKGIKWSYLGKKGDLDESVFLRKLN